MPRSRFLTDKNKQKEILTKFAEIINDYYKSKKIDKSVSVDDLIKKCEDPAKLARYDKCRKQLEENEELHKYSESLEKKYNLKIDPGYARHFQFLVQLPKGSEKEKEEIEKKNYEMLKRASDPNKINDLLKEDLKMLYDMDKMKLFPKDENEAIDNYIKEPKLYETAFVIGTMFLNSSKYPSNEIFENFNYYKSFIESASFNKLETKYYGSEFSLFLPEDLTNEDCIMLSSLMANYAFKEKDSFSKDAFDSFTQERPYYFDRLKVVDAEKKFVEEHDKDHRMFYNVDIGGETFEGEIKKYINEKRDPEVQHNFHNIDEALMEDPISFKNNDFPTYYQKKKSMIKELENGSLNFESYKKNIYSRKDNTFKRSMLHDMIAYYKFSESVDNDNARNFREEMSKVFKKEGISEKEIKEYSTVVNNEYPQKYVERIDANGIVFKANTRKDIVNKYTLDSTRLMKMSSIETKSKEGTFADNINERLICAKVAKERNMRRGFFSQIFSPDAWAERRIINSVRNDAVANGMTKDDFNALIVNEDNYFIDEITPQEAPAANGAQRFNIQVNELDENVNDNTKNLENTNDLSRDLDVSNEIDIDEYSV